MGLIADDDRILLEAYARTGDAAAFAELARRYMNLVYSAATRRVGDRHLAEDVAQAVFIILATRPSSALRSGALGGWLLATVRYAAANAMKIEKRRRRHEKAAAEAAAASAACSPNPSDVLVWQELAGRLDDAVLKLPKLDRQAVILRYFEQKGVLEVARALGVSEGAAKQRLGRSLEKLRNRLNRRGAGAALAGAAELASLLSAHAVRAAPPGLAASAVAAAGATAGGAAAVTIAKGAITMMNLTKLKAAAAVLAVAAVVGTGTAITVHRGSAQAQDGPTAAAAGGARLADKAAARVRAAEAVVQSLARRQEAGEPLTPEYIELKSVAQRRLTEARMEAAGSPAARAQAAEQGVEQSRANLKIVKARFDAGLDVSDVQVRQAEYYVADAEYVLAKVRP
jgi:RNA polymerase sigma factor (sigma-70 family)